MLFDFSNELTSEVSITGKQIIWLAGGGIWDINVLSLLGEKKKKAVGTIFSQQSLSSKLLMIDLLLRFCYKNIVLVDP